MARGEAADWGGNYIPQLIEEGFTASGALDFLKAQGLGIRRQTFLRAWGETITALERRAQVEQTNLTRNPLAEEVTPFTAPHATGYLYSVDVLIRDRLTGEVYTTPSGYRTQTLVPYRDALAEALAALQEAQAASENETPRGQILGGIVNEVRQFVPEPDEG